MSRFLLLLLLVLWALPLSIPEAIAPAPRLERLSCTRTYIVRPRGDAIRCTRCTAHFSDKTLLHKEGC